MLSLRWWKMIFGIRRFRGMVLSKFWCSFVNCGLGLMVG